MAMAVLCFLNCLSAIISPNALADDPAAHVLVVYNLKEPASRALAEYYAAKRRIPMDRLCAIKVRPVETITRNEFEEEIRAPILKYLIDQKLLVRRRGVERDPFLGRVPTFETVSNQIYYVALMYGVPLRIENDPGLLGGGRDFELPQRFRRNDAAVDSELALLPTVGVPTAGALRNPYFERDYTPFDGTLARHMMLVGRLDGPDPDTVRRMIDAAVETERLGLHGRGYFDGRGTKEPGYMAGDDWIREAYTDFQRAGYECELDMDEALYPEDAPLSDVAIYTGWYAAQITGFWKRPAFRFQPGALAYHIHSSSAAQLRTTQAYWAGPLLAHGAAATMGNVFEPFLQMSPQLNHWVKRLLDGGLLIEAGYVSQNTLSWQTTFIGDPIYRPFVTPLEEQIKRLEAERHADRQWAYLRQVNLLLRDNKMDQALALCREKAQTLASGVLYEKLGDLSRQSGRTEDAKTHYAEALVLAQRSENADQARRLSARLTAARTTP